MKFSILLQFVVDYPNEYITLVEGTTDGKLTSLKFTTSKGRTSPAFGNEDGRKFVFERTGFKLVGFVVGPVVLLMLSVHILLLSLLPFPLQLYPTPCLLPTVCPKSTFQLVMEGLGN